MIILFGYGPERGYTDKVQEYDLGKYIIIIIIIIVNHSCAASKFVCFWVSSAIWIMYVSIGGCTIIQGWISGVWPVMRPSPPQFQEGKSTQRLASVACPQPSYAHPMATITLTTSVEEMGKNSSNFYPMFKLHWTYCSGTYMFKSDPNRYHWPYLNPHSCCGEKQLTCDM